MGRFELIVRSEFSAAHQLRMPDGGYEPLHRHGWRVEVYLEGDALDDGGMLADFTALRRELARITGECHDTCLNDHPAFAACPPSTELIARHIYDGYRPTLPPQVKLCKVRVWETEDCAAAFIPTTGDGKPSDAAERTIVSDADADG